MGANGQATAHKINDLQNDILGIIKGVPSILTLTRPDMSAQPGGNKRKFETKPSFLRHHTTTTTTTQTTTLSEQPPDKTLSHLKETIISSKTSAKNSRQTVVTSSTTRTSYSTLGLTGFLTPDVRGLTPKVSRTPSALVVPVQTDTVEEDITETSSELIPPETTPMSITSGTDQNGGEEEKVVEPDIESTLKSVNEVDEIMAKYATVLLQKQKDLGLIKEPQLSEPVPHQIDEKEEDVSNEPPEKETVDDTLTPDDPKEAVEAIVPVRTKSVKTPETGNQREHKIVYPHILSDNNENERRHSNLSRIEGEKMTLPEIPRKNSKHDKRELEKRPSVDCKRRCVYCHQRNCDVPEHHDEKELFEKTAVTMISDADNNKEIMVEGKVVPTEFEWSPAPVRYQMPSFHNTVSILEKHRTDILDKIMESRESLIEYVVNSSAPVITTVKQANTKIPSIKEDQEGFDENDVEFEKYVEKILNETEKDESNEMVVIGQPIPAKITVTDQQVKTDSVPTISVSNENEPILNDVKVEQLPEKEVAPSNIAATTSAILEPPKQDLNAESATEKEQPKLTDDTKVVTQPVPPDQGVPTVVEPKTSLTSVQPEKQPVDELQSSINQSVLDYSLSSFKGPKPDIGISAINVTKSPKAASSERVNIVNSRSFLKEQLVPQLSRSSAKNNSERPQTLVDLIHLPKKSGDDPQKSLLITDIPQCGDIEEEIQRLTNEIKMSEPPSAVYLRKRGLLQAHVGRKQEALRDLNAAIHYDSIPIDNYWVRHQIHLLNNDVDEALKDIETIITNNRNHYGAWLTKARILKYKASIKQAIACYAQCIRIRPNDSLPYFERACLYETEGETVLAHEDFKIVLRLDPSNVRAILSQATYAYSKQLWNEAIQSFSRLLFLDPKIVTAYLHRGKANAQMNNWDEALEDFSTGIKIDPRNYEMFYARGCLLREVNYKQAIEDFSISLMLNNSLENADAYFYRAICYSKLQKYDLAMVDYQSGTSSTYSTMSQRIVLELDGRRALAHLNLGIIYMRQLRDYEASLEHLNLAIRYDSVLIRAYICRGELYTILHQTPGSLCKYEQRHKRRKFTHIDRAILDFTKAIHLSPNNYMLFLYRGRLLLKQCRVQMAMSDFDAALKLSAGTGKAILKRAFVLLFEKKYGEAVEEFMTYKKAHRGEDPKLTAVIARAKIKCNRFEEAIVDIEKSLQRNQNDPQLLLLRGICYRNLNENKKAVSEFSRVINLTPQNAKAYYYRGISRLTDKDNRGILDLCKSIKYDPKNFEAYLARAINDEKRKLYAQGVVNCNEALKIEPQSIRAYLMRGFLKFQIHQHGLAILDFTRAITMNRKCNIAFYYRAISNHLVGNNESAVRDYSLVILTDGKHSNAFRNRGLIYWRMGDHENAIIDFYESRKSFPNDAGLNGLLGLSLLKVGRMEEAVDAYSKAIVINPSVIEGYLSRGNVYMAMKQYTKARADYARALILNPRHNEAYINIAYTFQMEHNNEKAFEIYTTVLTLDPHSVLALQGRALIYMLKQNHVAAIADITSALLVDGGNAELWVNRGVIRQFRGDTGGAMKDYKHATEVDKTCALAYFNTANLYFLEERYSDALQYYTKALEIDTEDAMVYINNGIALSILKRYEEAEESFNQAIKIQESCIGYLNRARLYQLQGKYEEAESDLSEAVRVNPSCARQVHLLRSELKAFELKHETQTPNLKATLKEYAKGLVD